MRVRVQHRPVVVQWARDIRRSHLQLRVRAGLPGWLMRQRRVRRHMPHLRSERYLLPGHVLRNLQRQLYRDRVWPELVRHRRLRLVSVLNDVPERILRVHRKLQRHRVRPELVWHWQLRHVPIWRMRQRTVHLDLDPTSCTNLLHSLPHAALTALPAKTHSFDT